MYKKFLCIPLIAIGLLAGCASYETRSAAPARIESGTFVGTNGMTLYTFDKDEGGVSACYDKCAENWPPLLAAADAKAEGEYGLTDRTDGSKQWTYDGKPLYLWVKDQKPGDMTGDGVNDVWHTAKAD